LQEGDRRRPLLALATIRSDRLGEFLAADGFDLRYEALTVGPMPKARLRSVIEGPARVAGLTVEPVLVDRILADAASEGDRLSLIAFVLRDMTCASPNAAHACTGSRSVVSLTNKPIKKLIFRVTAAVIVSACDLRSPRRGSLVSLQLGAAAP
jgi:hypothetical protein